MHHPTRQKTIREIVKKVREGERQEIQGIRGIGKTHLLKEVERQLSLTRNYLPVRATFTPFLDNRANVFWSLVSAIAEKIGVKVKTPSHLAERLRSEACIELPDALIRDYSCRYHEWVFTLLSSIETDLGVIPLLMIDDFHYGKENAFVELAKYPVIFTSIFPIQEGDINRISIETLSVNEIYEVLQERAGEVEHDGAKTLKELTGGIPSYLHAMLPKLSDWVKRRKLSLDKVIVRRVWEEEIKGGILSLMARAYIQTYLTFFGKEAIMDLMNLGAEKKVISSPNFEIFRKIGLVKENSIVDNVLEEWLRRVQKY